MLFWVEVCEESGDIFSSKQRLETKLHAWFLEIPQASSSLPLILCTPMSLSIRFFNFFQLLHIFSIFSFFELHAWFPWASFSLPLLFCITLSLSIRFFQNGKRRLGDNRRMHIATIIRKAFETEQAAMATEWSELFLGHEEKEKVCWYWNFVQYHLFVNFVRFTILMLNNV